MSILRAIFVDLDGTLARTVDANSAAYQRALAEVGVTISQKQFEWKAQGRNWRQFLPEFLSDAGVDADPEKIADRKIEIYRSELPHIQINQALVSILETGKSHQMKTALVTSASMSTVRTLLSVKEITHLFDTLVTGDDVRYHKPHPEPYILAAERLMVEPEECIVYEDSDVGFDSATAFGAHVIRVVF